jgi:hypothetical protein
MIGRDTASRRGEEAMDDAKLQELSDVREIIDVMNRYTTALDTRNWAMLEATMTPDGLPAGRQRRSAGFLRGDVFR